MKNFLLNGLVKIEVSIILFFFIVYYFMKVQVGSINISPELLINFIFVSLLIALFIFRDSNIRHMYFAFIFLLLTVMGNLIQASDLIYISSSLTLSLFILGVLNMVLFKRTSNE